MYWIHKHSILQEYGGPEEGGWWYERGFPLVTCWQYIPIPVEEWALAICRRLNGAEHVRRDNEEEYEYTSVLSYNSNHYAYSVHEHRMPVPYPERRPHYE
jgi:hypothetical protein